MTSSYYVYIVYRPDGRPCYVGKGKGARWLAHFKKCRNPHLKRVLDQAALNGEPVWACKVSEGLTCEQSSDLEIQLISELGRKHAGGPLTNLTDGGEGTAGVVYSQERREKLSRSLLGGKRSPETCERLRHIFLGREITPEWRAKMAAAKIGGAHSAEHNAKISASLTGRTRTEEERKSISAGKAGMRFTEAHKAALAEAWTRRREKFGGRYHNKPKDK